MEKQQKCISYKFESLIDNGSNVIAYARLYDGFCEEKNGETIFKRRLKMNVYKMYFPTKAEIKEVVEGFDEWIKGKYNDHRLYHEDFTDEIKRLGEREANKKRIIFS